MPSPLLAFHAINPKVWTDHNATAMQKPPVTSRRHQAKKARQKPKQKTVNRRLIKINERDKMFAERKKWI